MDALNTIDDLSAFVKRKLTNVSRQLTDTLKQKVCMHLSDIYKRRLEKIQGLSSNASTPDEIAKVVQYISDYENVGHLRKLNVLVKLLKHMAAFMEDVTKAIQTFAPDQLVEQFEALQSSFLEKSMAILQPLNRPDNASMRLMFQTSHTSVNGMANCKDLVTTFANDKLLLRQTHEPILECETMRRAFRRLLRLILYLQIEYRMYALFVVAFVQNTQNWNADGERATVVGKTNEMYVAASAKVFKTQPSTPQEDEQTLSALVGWTVQLSANFSTKITDLFVELESHIGNANNKIQEISAGLTLRLKEMSKAQGGQAKPPLQKKAMANRLLQLQQDERKQQQEQQQEQEQQMRARRLQQLQADEAGIEQDREQKRRADEMQLHQELQRVQAERHALETELHAAQQQAKHEREQLRLKEEELQQRQRREETLQSDLLQHQQEVKRVADRVRQLEDDNIRKEVTLHERMVAEEAMQRANDRQQEELRELARAKAAMQEAAMLAQQLKEENSRKEADLQQRLRAEEEMQQALAEQRQAVADLAKEKAEMQRLFEEANTRLREEMDQAKRAMADELRLYREQQEAQLQEEKAQLEQTRRELEEQTRREREQLQQAAAAAAAAEEEKAQQRLRQQQEEQQLRQQELLRVQWEQEQQRRRQQEQEQDKVNLRLQQQEFERKLAQQAQVAKQQAMAEQAARAAAQKSDMGALDDGNLLFRQLDRIKQARVSVQGHDTRFDAGQAAAAAKGQTNPNGAQAMDLKQPLPVPPKPVQRRHSVTESAEWLQLTEIVGHLLAKEIDPSKVSFFDDPAPLFAVAKKRAITKFQLQLLNQGTSNEVYVSTHPGRQGQVFRLPKHNEFFSAEDCFNNMLYLQKHLEIQKRLKNYVPQISQIYICFVHNAYTAPTFLTVTAMERVKALDMQKTLPNRLLVHSLFASMLDIMSAMCQAKLFHGDLHAGNMLFCDQGNGHYCMKLVDFDDSCINTTDTGVIEELQCDPSDHFVNVSAQTSPPRSAQQAGLS